MAMTRNLQPVSGRSFVFVCLKSERARTKDDRTRADLNGPSYRAFYCGDCLQTETEQS
jgi:hypothetical protein